MEMNVVVMAAPAALLGTTRLTLEMALLVKAITAGIILRGIIRLRQAAAVLVQQEQSFPIQTMAVLVVSD